MNIEIWGTYPPPIGGVSIHVYRLIHSLYVLDNKVILRNFGKSKSEYKYIKNVYIRIWEFVKLLFVRQKIIHTHSNSILSFFLFYIFGYRHKIGITIHNKRLIKSRNIIKKIIIKKFFFSVRFIIMNDPEYQVLLQNEFYIDKDKIFILPAFIPPLHVEWIGLDKRIIEFREKHEFLISANAYKLGLYSSIDVYGLDMLIEIVNRLKYQGIDAGLIFCLPMIGDRRYYNKCNELVNNLNLSKNIMIFQELIPNGFEIWKISDLFVRPTYTDMEGISVKEALYCGTPVIASDVCIRPQEVILFRNRDVDDLYQKIYTFYVNKKSFKPLNKFMYNPVEDIVKIYRSME